MQKKEDLKECYHCHGECFEEIQYNDKVFCCDGCKTVYEILVEGNLENFYQLNEEAGLRPDATSKGKYDFLELPEIRKQLIAFEEEDIVKISFHLPKIHCSSCLYLLERLDKIQKGVLQSQVDFAAKNALITFNSSEIKLSQLAELLATIGYPPSINLEDYDKTKPAKKNNSLVIKIGVVGFCFGNIMLMSFPEYLGISEADRNFQLLFNWLNLGLSLPILIYGAQEYIVGAYKSLRLKKIQLDVPIAMGIFALFLRSTYEILWEVGPGYLDSFAGLIFFLLVGKWFQQRTYSTMNFERDYASYFPIAVTKTSKSGDEELIPLKAARVGDRLLIRNGELIPADAILISEQAHIDYSFVTGESRSIKKESGSKMFAGGKNKGKNIEVEMIKEVENSYLTNLWKNPIFNKQKEYESFADRISKYFTTGVIIVALSAGIFWYFIDPGKATFVVTSVLIVACPCAIALSEPFTYSNLIRILGKHNFYTRSTDVAAELNGITDIVFDKTGTLSRLDESEIAWEGEHLNNKDEAIIFGLTSQSSHPLSRMIASFIGKQASVEIDKYEEIPGKGIQAEVDGDTWKIGSAKFMNLDLALIQTKVFIAKNNVVLGAFAFANKYRPGIETLITKLKKSYTIHIVSGDNESEAAKLNELFGEAISMKFNAQPQDKLEYIAALQQAGKKVLMLGDGLNDAGALKQSDFGVSVAEDILAFSPSADAILKARNLVHLDKYLEYGNFGAKTVKRSYFFSLMYNLTGLGFAIFGLVTPLFAAILMPLSSISVVLFTTATTNIKGLRLFNSKR